jgi:energy-coupling factor transport system permease protein
MSVFDGLKFRKVYSPIHNLDPRVKFIYVCAVFVAAIIFGELLPLIALLLMQIPFVLLAGVQREWLRSLRGAAFLAAIIFFTNFLFSFVSAGYVVLAANLEWAAAMTLRFVVLVESFSVFFLTTSPDHLGLALELTHVPYEFAFAFTTAVRFVPVLAEEAQTIMDAQKARGLELEKLAEAMESRAWGATKKRTNLYALKLRRGDFALLAITIAVLVASIYIRLYVYVPTLNQLLQGFF